MNGNDLVKVLHERDNPLEPRRHGHLDGDGRSRCAASETHDKIIAGAACSSANGAATASQFGFRDSVMEIGGIPKKEAIDRRMESFPVGDRLRFGTVFDPQIDVWGRAGRIPEKEPASNIVATVKVSVVRVFMIR